MTATRIRTFTVDGPVLELFVSDCAACGVVFGIPKDLERLRRNDRKDFYCPNGHSLAFGGKTDEQKLREAQARETALRDQLEAAAREVESTKAELLRDRHRFANGVCPCCNRSFGNVARHMRSQHPDYDVTAVESQAQPQFECSCSRTFSTLGGLHRHQTAQRQPDWYRPGAWGAHLTVV